MLTQNKTRQQEEAYGNAQPGQDQEEDEGRAGSDHQMSQRGADEQDVPPDKGEDSDG